MRCLACKSDTMVDATTTYFAQVSSGYVIIENVPCKKCTQCGEEFFSASVVECIEQILDKNNLYNHWFKTCKNGTWFTSFTGRFIISNDNNEYFSPVLLVSVHLKPPIFSKPLLLN